MEFNMDNQIINVAVVSLNGMNQSFAEGFHENPTLFPKASSGNVIIQQPMEMYVKFRGKEPDPDALLRRDQLLN